MIKIWFMETSQPVEVRDARNAYTKGALYCIAREDGTVIKFPLCNIFMIEEPNLLKGE